MIFAAVLIAMSLTVLAATGLVAMAMYVSATDEHKFTDEDYVP